MTKKPFAKGHPPLNVARAGGGIVDARNLQHVRDGGDAAALGGDLSEEKEEEEEVCNEEVLLL